MNESKTTRVNWLFATTDHDVYPLPGKTVIGTNSVFHNYTSTRSGVSVANWRTKIRNGSSATSPFNGTKYSPTAEPGLMIYRRFDKVTGALIKDVQSQGFFTDPVGTVPSGSMITADNLALKGLYKRIREERSTFQGQIFLGELRETMRMLKSPAKVLMQGISDYVASASKRVQRVKRPAAISRILSDTWLEYSFGWVPLLSDIAEAQKAYVKHLSGVRTTRITYRGSESESEPNTTKQTYVGYFPLLYTEFSIVTRSVQYRVGLRTVAQGASPDVSVAERAGLVFSQFVPTLWELCPWSFLVDYFTNIGDIVDAGATSTSDVIWVCKTTKSISTRRWNGRVDQLRAQADSAGYHVSAQGDPGTWTAIYATVARNSSSLTLPRFEVSIPGQPLKWLNMAALARSVPFRR